MSRCPAGVAVIRRVYPDATCLRDGLHSLLENISSAAALLQALEQPGDPPEYTDQLLSRTIVWIPPTAPPLPLQQLRLSQRFTQEQVDGVAVLGCSF
jgi:hypothetical protein